jgi:hypothetical protein
VRRAATAAMARTAMVTELVLAAEPASALPHTSTFASAFPGSNDDAQSVRDGQGRFDCGKLLGESSALLQLIVVECMYLYYQFG